MPILSNASQSGFKFCFNEESFTIKLLNCVTNLTESRSIEIIYLRIDGRDALILELVFAKNSLKASNNFLALASFFAEFSIVPFLLRFDIIRKCLTSNSNSK